MEGSRRTTRLDELVSSRTQTILQLRSLVLTADEDLRDELRDMRIDELVARCACWHRKPATDALQATRQAMRSLARRHRDLDEEIVALDAEIAALNERAVPRLLAEHGVGRVTAARLLIVAGDSRGLPDYRVTLVHSLAVQCVRTVRTGGRAEWSELRW